MSSFQRVPYGIHPVSSYWQDVDFPIIVRTTGVGRPVLTAVRGNIEAPLWAVNDNLQIEGQEIVHSYKEGSTIQWHIHMITAGTEATDAYVKWQIEWVWGNANSALSDTITTTSDDLLIAADTPDRSMIVREIKQIAMPTMNIGAHIWARLTRVAADGTAPAGNVFASMLQLHIECDSPGSTGIFTK